MYVQRKETKGIEKSRVIDYVLQLWGMTVCNGVHIPTFGQ